MDYSKLQKLAYNQISDKGSLMSIIRQTNSSFDATIGSYTTAETYYSCYGVRLKLTEKNAPEGTLVEQSLRGMQAIQRDTVTFLIAAKDLEIVPTRTDKVEFSSVRYEINNVEILSPGGTDIIYKINARK